MRRRGFTLLEMMVALTLAALVALLAHQMFSGVLDASRRATEAQATLARQMNARRWLVEAFGAPQSYNLYTFAKHFQPSDLRLIFARAGNVLDRPEEFPGSRREQDDSAGAAGKEIISAAKIFFSQRGTGESKSFR